MIMKSYKLYMFFPVVYFIIASPDLFTVSVMETVKWISSVAPVNMKVTKNFYGLWIGLRRNCIMPKQIENVINLILNNDAQKNALNFVKYLRSNDMEFDRGKGYWEDKSYWMIKYKGKYVCFILIGGDEEKDSSWTIWSDDSGSVWFEGYSLNEYTKKIAHANIDFCGNCGSCSGGTSKTIFGKIFDNVCRTTFRFDNPDYEAVACTKKLVEIRKNDICEKV